MASNLNFELGFVKPNINDISQLLYISLWSQTKAFKNDYNKSLNVGDIYKISQSMNIGKKFDSRESEKIVSIPFIGYQYSEEMEYLTDDIVLNLLKKENININEYKMSILKLIKIYEQFPEIYENISNKLNKRLERIWKTLY